jgi:hypothetical protein
MAKYNAQGERVCRWHSDVPMEQRTVDGATVWNCKHCDSEALAAIANQARRWSEQQSLTDGKN